MRWQRQAFACPLARLAKPATSLIVAPVACAGKSARHAGPVLALRLSVASKLTLLPTENDEIVGFRRKPGITAPGERAHRFSEGLTAAIEIGRHECDMLGWEASTFGNPQQRRFARIVDRAIRVNDFHKDQQRMGGPKIVCGTNFDHRVRRD